MLRGFFIVATCMQVPGMFCKGWAMHMELDRGTQISQEKYIKMDLMIHALVSAYRMVDISLSYFVSKSVFHLFFSFFLCF
jgi:hypothetical protein